MAQTKDGIVVGIDLGTTFSLVSILQDGRPMIIPNALGELLTPSAVGVDDDGKFLVGAAARARVGTHPTRTATMFKRDMGTDVTRTLAEGVTLRPEELSAMVLGALKRDAEAALGMPVIEAVVTVPAYFGETQRQATKDAARIAGLHVERIVNEPTAAALAYGLHRRDTEQRIAVLDLGGGTFDVSILEIIEGVVEIQGSAGDPRLGGEDFTDALAGLLGGRIDAAHGDVWRGDLKNVARVRECAERAKRALASADVTDVALPSLRSGAQSFDFSTSLDVRELEPIFHPLVERLRIPIQRALRDARALPSAIDEVLLVGGATRMREVAALASSIFGKLPLRDVPPDEAVAMGAAIQAALKHGDAAVDDLVVTDVSPFTLGIASASKHGVHVVNGLFSPLIDRGTVIPASRVERFYTMVDNQSEIRLEIFQGEHSLCRDNVKIGTLNIDGIPRMPAGDSAIDVRFTYDLNGLLEVDVEVVGTKRKKRLLVEKKPGQLTEAQITEARRAMERLKFHPRDSLPNRTALARADALFAELTGMERQELGSAIQRMHGALLTQDRGVVDECRERLVALTQAFSAGPRH